MKKGHDGAALIPVTELEVQYWDRINTGCLEIQQDCSGNLQASASHSEEHSPGIPDKTHELIV